MLNRHDRLSAAIEAIAAKATCRDELTCARVEEHAGVSFPAGDTALRHQLRSAKLRLAARTPLVGPDDIPTGDRKRKVLRRTGLRPDIAAVCWEVLRGEVSRVDRAPSSVVGRFNAFRFAGELLADDVPDIQTISLAQLQTAWFREPRASRHETAREGIASLLELLLASETMAVNQAELARCLDWLGSIVLRRPAPTTAALSAEQSDELVATCVAIIEAGRRRVASNPDLTLASTLPTAAGNGIEVIDWGLALAILVGRFTGLRASSISGIDVSELGLIGHETYAVIWRHTKKAAPEERLAIVPASLTALLREYEATLAPLRREIGTERLFLRPGQAGLWEPAVDLTGALRSFVRRRLPASLAGLTIALLRRTFATRAVAEGRSLAAVAAQLGHAEIRTTLRYTKFERSQHAVEVRSALDRYGRVVLDRWRRPVLLADLPGVEQAELAATAQMRDCGVGLCRPGQCVMVGDGAPPPCLACSHLATGPEFYPAWDAEIKHRRLRIDELSEPSVAMLTVAASEATQLAEIERIYAELCERAPR